MKSKIKAGRIYIYIILIFNYHIHKDVILLAYFTYLEIEN